MSWQNKLGIKSYWTLPYIANRIILWFDQARYPDDPWITRQAIQFISKWLIPTDIGLEFGSGRSTIWFAKRVDKLLSVESDIQWYQKISKAIKELSLNNISYHYQPVDISEDLFFNHPYLKIIDQIPDNKLNFGLVDGMFRDYCAIALTKKLCTGGILIVDNIERYLPSLSKSPEFIGPNKPPLTNLWEEYVEIVADWRCLWMTNGVTDTAIWIKPYAS